MVTESAGGRKAVEDLLVQDFSHWSESFWNNETVGEQRVQLFIGFVAAVLGGLAALAKGETDFQWAAISGIGISAVGWSIVLGLFVLSRVLKRNRATDRYHYALDAYREIHGDERINERLKHHKLMGEKPKRHPFSGGLLNLVIVINVGLATVGGWFCAYAGRTCCEAPGWQALLAWCGVWGAAALAVQVAMVRRFPAAEAPWPADSAVPDGRTTASV